MADIIVSAQDVKDADTFLTAYLSSKITDADFSEGGVIRDFTVQAMAYVFAYLRKEIKEGRDHQSLSALAALPDGDETVDDAADALLSNWFLTRKSGRKARVTATLHFNRLADVQLNPTTRFFRSSALVYTPDVTSSYVVPASELRPSVNADGSITDYTLTVTLVAADVGKVYNVQPGRFVSADPFSPYFTYAENLSQGYDGKGQETTSEMLERAPTAISVRNLVNRRSVDAVLRNAFSGVSRVFTAGFGDPEMLRDYAEESVSKLKVHLGGFKDIYVDLSRTEVTETLTVGAAFARPDNLIATFRDAVVDFVASSVAVGDVLRVTAGLPNVPREYIITNVTQHALQIQPRSPFETATDETATFVSYSIGRFAPTFDSVVTTKTTGQTSRRIQQSGRVTLSGRPHYAIRKVEVLNGDGTVTELGPRTNTTVDTTNYRVHVAVPSLAQSGYAVTQLELSPTYDSKQVRVTYETLVGYEDVQQLVVDPFERTVCDDALVKGLHPVYVTVNMAVELKPTATESLDTDAVASSVVDYINSFAPTETLDVSAISAHVRSTFPQVGKVFDPLAVTYTLLAADGQVYEYTTRDVVTIHPSYPGSRARLLNGQQLATPLANAELDASVGGTNETLFVAAAAELKKRLLALGITDRNVRYLCQVGDVTVTEV